MGKVSFRTSSGERVSFTTGRRKKKRSGGTTRARYELWSIHDGGDREVRRWKGSSEEAAEKEGRELSRIHGWLLDLLRIDGKKKIHLRSFGG